MRKILNKIKNIAAVALLVPILGVSAQSSKIEEVHVDFAYYSPSSLVLKKFGWLEEALKKEGIQVKWVHSAGSNRALEYLNSGSVEFGSTAGLSAVLARANGSEIKAVYVYSQPEWTALVVSKDSEIKSVTDLRGKKIAATKGTDPYLFLLRSLQKFGIKKSEVEIVHLQHADGRAALEQGRVDAWVGLDPHMASSELEAGSKLIYRNVNFNTYGFLNVPEKFAKEHPEVINTVIQNYERARKWILSNPEEAAKILATEANISVDVAKLQLIRTGLKNPVIGQEHITALSEAAPILVEEKLVKPETDVSKVIGDLIDPSFVQTLIK